MSQQNLVTVSITPEELKQISGAIDTLRTTLLPKLKALKPDERMELPKMGDKTVAFVKKALEHCTQNPELAPQYLDVSEYQKDVVAVETLKTLHSPISQIAEALSDTMILSGSDAYSAALMFYNSVKIAKKSNVAKAGTIHDDLSERFPGKVKGAVKQAVQ